MRRPLVATVAVVLLAVTAGCGGVLGGEDAVRTPYDVSATPTPTPTVAPGATVPRSLAVTLSEQESRLRAAGSYTLQLNQTDAGSNGTLTNTYRVERADERGSIRVVVDDPDEPNASRRVVFRGETAFVARRTAPDGDQRVRNVTGSIRTPTNVSVDVFGSVATDLLRSGLERTGTTTVDGEAMARYTASGPTDAPPSAMDPATYRATLLVDDDGLVRVYEWRTVRRTDDDERLVFRGRLELTAVGDTAVGTPAWVGNATTTPE
jgi:hypothetical protein